MMTKRELFLLRGLPGSGKSTVANSIADVVFSNDMFFTFDLNRIQLAVNWCRGSVLEAMRRGVKKIAVANTFTTEEEMSDYFVIAHRNGYQVHSLIVENRHEGVSLHPVPKETIARMKGRFNVKLAVNEAEKT